MNIFQNNKLQRVLESFLRPFMERGHYPRDRLQFGKEDVPIIAFFMCGRECYGTRFSAGSLPILLVLPPIQGHKFMGYLLSEKQKAIFSIESMDNLLAIKAKGIMSFNMTQFLTPRMIFEQHEEHSLRYTVMEIGVQEVDMSSKIPDNDVSSSVTKISLGYRTGS